MRTIVLYGAMFLILSMSGCTKQVSVPGQYEVEAKTIDDRLFLSQMRSEGRVIGSKLNLNADSTFFYLTCGNQMTGHWKNRQDSILLYVVTNSYRTDSMRSAGAIIIPHEPIVFHTRQRKLYRVWETADSTRTVELLTKKD